ncbi:DegT/DnrJ/EryC1/StrS family aminotransferase, partial [Acidobacteria bacterium AH-259-G07]|nr:DegT/DnrJ/EryC1/StrS family aminotransferase [Acidobacteria bacterium AH-259-G07]
ILAVHIYGHPVDLDPILEVAAEYGIPVIEDAAESLGALYKGRHVGTFGCLGCFSFNGNKVITTGGGGMIVTDDPELAGRAKHLTTQARLPELEYRHDEIGFNYGLTNVQAALGVAQLEQLTMFLEKKRAIVSRYSEYLKDLPGISWVNEAPWARSSWWMYSILIDTERYGRDRNEVMSILNEREIHTRPVWTPIHTLPIYSTYPRVGGQTAEELFSQGLCVPCSASLSHSDQDVVLEHLRKCYRPSSR